MKLGYQDAGSWTFLKSTPLERRKAAWLYAQFVVSKTVSLKKTLVGLTPIRDSDLRSAAMSREAPRLGGLVEFYRSPARVLWTPTGTNVPDYPKLAQLWWPNVANAVSGTVSPQEAMNTLAREQDEVLARLERIGIPGRLRAATQPGNGPGRVARPARCAEADTGERKAAGTHGTLRSTDRDLAGRLKPVGTQRPDQPRIAGAAATGEPTTIQDPPERRPSAYRRQSRDFSEDMTWVSTTSASSPT